MTAQQASEERVAVSAVNFVRAETDTYFDNLLRTTGALGMWHHNRRPTPVDEQTVIRMNRDTLYSTVVLDVSEGAAVTLPDADGRYQTAMVVDQDHFVEKVFDRPGTHRVSPDEVGSAYVAVAFRTLVNPSDPDDIAAVAALQDGLAVSAASARPFTHPAWDQTSLTATRTLLLELARAMDDTRGAFGSRTRTDPVKHLLGTAFGWGGLPDEQAHYIGVEPRLPVGSYTLTVGDVPVRAFWSVSVYNRDGFFEKNDLGRYSVNSVTAAKNDDGTVTIHFGGDPDRPNQIPIVEGWGYVVRLYQPAPEVLDGSWTFPGLDPVGT